MLNRNDVDDVRGHFRCLKKLERFVRDKSGVKMLEVVHASFEANEETIFGPVNWDYVERELEWYNSRSLNVNDIPGGPPAIWKQVATKDGWINSNYGWMIYSTTNGNQFEYCRNELIERPDSRRAVMIYNRPSMWFDYNREGMSDFVCTFAHQYFVRDGKLHACVTMRSNDVVFGYRNDRAWADHVLNRLSNDIGVPKGKLYWYAGSLHVYERHFDLIV
jgi:thymidylate synthase